VVLGMVGDPMLMVVGLTQTGMKTAITMATPGLATNCRVTLMVAGAMQMVAGTGRWPKKKRT
jgi:hypothetical protein